MRARLGDPAFLFCLLSLLFGGAVIAINPPSRGPDEGAHFLRIYSIAQGEIVPKQVDERGRRGFMLAAQVYADFSYFEIARHNASLSGVSLRDLMSGFASARAEPETNTNSLAVFQPFGGSEAYSPAPYAPYIAAALLTRALNFDFLSTFYTMRIAGVVAFTAITAYAIVMTPCLKWAFFIIAMLPSALYGRAVLSADGAAMSTTLVVLALCLRASHSKASAGTAQRSIWMTWCLLVKPAQTALLLLEGMTTTLTGQFRRKAAVAAIVLPGVGLTAVWLFVTSADVAAWRITDGTDISPNEFSPGWKLRFMLQHPWHFPAAVLRSLDYSVELWRQLIGVLGWLDTYLIWLAYPLLSALLLPTFFEALMVDSKTRYRIAFWCAAAIAAYALAIFLIFFLIWTPTSSDRVLGVQGRYFLVILPPMALCFAAIANRTAPRIVVKSCAIGSALLSGAATIAALIQVHG